MWCVCGACIKVKKRSVCATKGKTAHQHDQMIYRRVMSHDSQVEGSDVTRWVSRAVTESGVGSQPEPEENGIYYLQAK